MAQKIGVQGKYKKNKNLFAFFPKALESYTMTSVFITFITILKFGVGAIPWMLIGAAIFYPIMVFNLYIVRKTGKRHASIIELGYENMLHGRVWKILVFAFVIIYSISCISFDFKFFSDNLFAYSLKVNFKYNEYIAWIILLIIGIFSFVFYPSSSRKKALMVKRIFVSLFLISQVILISWNFFDIVPTFKTIISNSFNFLYFDKGIFSGFLSTTLIYWGFQINMATNNPLLQGIKPFYFVEDSKKIIRREKNIYFWKAFLFNFLSAFSFALVTTQTVVIANYLNIYQLNFLQINKFFYYFVILSMIIISFINIVQFLSFIKIKALTMHLSKLSTFIIISLILIATIFLVKQDVFSILTFMQFCFAFVLVFNLLLILYFIRK